MKLTEKEESALKEIMAEYHATWQSITLTEHEIESLKYRLTGLVNRLEVVRKIESEFTEKIKNKYGEGVLDLKTMAYKLNE